MYEFCRLKDTIHMNRCCGEDHVCHPECTKLETWSFSRGPADTSATTTAEEKAENAATETTNGRTAVLAVLEMTRTHSFETTTTPQSASSAANAAHSDSVL